VPTRRAWSADAGQDPSLRTAPPAISPGAQSHASIRREPVENPISQRIFGLLATFFVVPALLLLTIGVFRLADAYLPGEVWSAWLVLAGIFLACGAFVWSKRNP